MPNTVIVPVKSAWSSKVNWLQAAGLVTTFLTGIVGALNLDPVQTAQVTALVGMGTQILTIVARTFFTKSVTTASLPKED